MNISLINIQYISLKLNILHTTSSWVPNTADALLVAIKAALFALCPSHLIVSSYCINYELSAKIIFQIYIVYIIVPFRYNIHIKVTVHHWYIYIYIYKHVTCIHLTCKL